MQRAVLWSAWDGPGLEHLRLVGDAIAIAGEGVVIGQRAGQPFRLNYALRYTANWMSRAAAFALPGGPSLLLRSDAPGIWLDRAGRVMRDLDGCLALDLSATPFTTTQAIQRLALAPGDAQDLLVVSVDGADLAVRPVRQRYTCLARDAAGGRYRYESLTSGFAVELAVDADGLVLDYPGLWRRVALPA